MTGQQYSIYGYKGKQVRDNIHSHDLVTAFWHFFQVPRPGEVYNMGGSRFLAGSRVVDYPALKMLLNRAANTFIRVLFGLQYNDVEA